MWNGSMHVYLSPHNDDVCFSIAHIASRFRGDLVNLFTRSRFVKAVNIELPSDEEERIEVISQLRRQEDQLFTEAAGLVRHDLGLSEPALIGYDPFDLTDVKSEAGALSERLIPFLSSMLPAEGDPSAASLYCPIGIGGHRNHLSTLLAVRNACDDLSRRCTVFLYEDLPYANDPRARQNGLRRAATLFGATFGATQLSPIVFPIDSDDAQRKMGFIRLYATQHRHVPGMVEFTPASGRVEGLHEIVWKVLPSIGV
jgi:hypothetical protein